MMDVGACQRHISYKRQSEGLDPEVAERMLAALNEGAAPDYQALLRAAQWPPPPALMYHTADRSDRASIKAHGLRVSLPSEGNWTHLKGLGQRAGIYVTPAPDLIGKWSHWPEHDVWAVDHTYLPMERDELNPGSWVILEDANPSTVQLLLPGCSFCVDGRDHLLLPGWIYAPDSHIETNSYDQVVTRTDGAEAMVMRCSCNPEPEGTP